MRTPTLRPTARPSVPRWSRVPGRVTARGSLVGMLSVVGVMSACATLRPSPSDAAPLVGVWMDLRHATPSDTTAWLLDRDGHDATLHIRPTGLSAVPDRATMTPFGRWYVAGPVSDTARRRLCFRARRAAFCYRFTLDTLRTNASALDTAASPSRAAAASLIQRRLVVYDYHGEHHTRDAVLLERLDEHLARRTGSPSAIPNQER